MAAPRYNVHQEVSEADVASLRWLADDVSRSFFKSAITVDVRWGIPSASEAAEPKVDIEPLNTEMKTRLQAAVTSIKKHDFNQAKKDLEPLFRIGHEEASKLYVKVLQKLGDPKWETIARDINRVSTDTLFVPAGSTESRDGALVIIVHQSLSKSLGYNAPRCVIQYVLHHEYLHMHFQTDPVDPHPQLFRRFDKCFPQRQRCISWLKKNHFTTLED
jgi:hypothetical protein